MKLSRILLAPQAVASDSSPIQTTAQQITEFSTVTVFHLRFISSDWRVGIFDVSPPPRFFVFNCFSMPDGKLRSSIAQTKMTAKQYHYDITLVSNQYQTDFNQATLSAFFSPRGGAAAGIRFDRSQSREVSERDEIHQRGLSGSEQTRPHLVLLD